MAKERLKSPRARLFIALDLPERMRAGLAEWGERELRDPALRPVSKRSLHVTLAFLGYRPEKEVPQLAEILAASEKRTVRLELRDPVARPERGRPRLFALPAISADAEKLQVALQERLVSEGLYEPEKRPFWPHITVARVRPEERRSRRTKEVSRPPGGLPKELLQPTDCVRASLYRSELKPQGALYTPLAQVELSGPDGSEVI
jgi:RNA 2',3'-cyclic 3'-phosphodiesterase